MDNQVHNGHMHPSPVCETTSAEATKLYVSEGLSSEPSRPNVSKSQLDLTLNSRNSRDKRRRRGSARSVWITS